MSFETVDTSVQDAQPVYLYEFVSGASVARFASCAKDVGTHPIIYSASAISAGNRRVGENIFKESLKIKFARSDLFAKQYIWNAPDAPTTVTVKRWHRTLPIADAVVEWKGRVVSATTDDTTVTLECESIYTSLKRIGLAMQFEISCVHPLYSVGCAASKVAAQASVTVLSVSGPVIEVDTLIGFDNGWFSGGLLEFAGDSRFILQHSGNNLRLASLMTTLEIGSSIVIYPGCDKAMATCISKFNNIDNYLGFPWMPNRNPFDGQTLA